MADEDDADDEEKGISSSRYPCMPSLVALQQMRNRLHLAYLGKKLMKWTAQATIRELRRISHEIILQYADFKEEIAEAFILLARSRFYQPTLNKIVLENVPNMACLHIGTTTRSVSGVRLYVLEIIETEEVPYTFLGLEKGGQTIAETKKAWLDLLKKMIIIAELRKGFQDVDYANKTATKRCNVIKRILIPKLKKTIVYILSELEEREREETFRIKQFKKLKDRRKKKDVKNEDKKEKDEKKEDEDSVQICSICLAMLERHKELRANKDKELENMDDQIYTEPCAFEDNTKHHLESLKNHIAEVISLTKACKQEGLVSGSMDKFIKTCCAVKEQLENGDVPSVCEVCMEKIQKLDRDETSEMTEESTDIYDFSSESSHKLGYFEKKFKEIIKVTRLQNDDGTIHEEKQVITIKTKRSNPMKPSTGSFKGNDDNPYLGPGDYDGNSGNNFRFPRNTKSEYTRERNKTEEHNLRKCMSADYQKPERDAAINFSDCSSLISPLNSDKSSCGSRTGSAPPVVTSQTSNKIHSCKSISSTHTYREEIPDEKPVQQCHPCCLTSCHVDAVESKKSESGKAVSFQTKGADALWRDASTSTTELNHLPDTTPSTVRYVTNNNCDKESKEPQPTEKPMIKCRIRLLPKSSEAESEKIYNSVTIKEEKPKEENTNQEKLIAIRDSLIDILKSIILEKPIETESTTKSFTKAEKPNLFCKSCYSRLSNYATNQDLDGPSVHSNPSSCKLCQASIESDKQETSVSTSNSSPSLSFKSLGTGLSSSHFKCSEPEKKSTSEDWKTHNCCIDMSKDQSPKKPTGCSLSATIPDKKSRSCKMKNLPSAKDTTKTHKQPHNCIDTDEDQNFKVCSGKDTPKKVPGKSTATKSKKELLKSSSESNCNCASSTLQKPNQLKCLNTKNASTTTKRNNKYDVRYISDMPSSSKSFNTKNECTCQSLPNLCGDRNKNPYFRKSKSCCVNNDYFKW